MKKTTLLFLISFPMLVGAQKIKVNQYDKFIKQRVIETTVSSLKYEKEVGLFMSLKAINTTCFVQMKGYGLGKNSLEKAKTITLHLDNDSAVLLSSSTMPYYDEGRSGLYIYEYAVSRDELNQLSLHGVKKISGLKEGVSLVIPSSRQSHTRQLSQVLLDVLPEEHKPVAAKGVQQIQLNEAPLHVGDSVRVCGKIFSSVYLQRSDSRPTLLNVGAAYPHQLLTVVIYGTDRNKFDEAPESFFLNKEVCITGKIELFKNQPQIVVHNREQIAVDNKAEIAKEEKSL